VAFFVLAVTAWPSHFWRISDDFEAEPVQRIIFLLALTCTIAASGRERTVRLAFVIAGLFLCVTHLKVQWYVGALLLLPVLLVHFRAVGASLGSSVALCVAVSVIPLSVVAVNWIGWRTTSLNPGIGLHVNLKFNGDVLRAFGEAAGGADRVALADPAGPRVEWWNVHVGTNVSRQEYDEFDRYATTYVRSRPGAAIRAFAEGLILASTVPGVEREPRGLIRLEPLERPWSLIVRCADVVVWVLLLMGLGFAETRLACALGLVLWIVPAIGNAVSLYEPRYHLPMAGIAASAGACVLAHLVERRTGRLLAGRRAVQ
jgi:hypothetical protein